MRTGNFNPAPAAIILLDNLLRQDGAQPLEKTLQDALKSQAGIQPQEIENNQAGSLDAVIRATSRAPTPHP